ncbi:hypothetical protein DSO57_1030572 [Entomophthora muscae]|uniref:Uncharacterized protein n=1 Tax=Entomophthora muscae TaxID=34485 RepID=A0ACC2ULQ1_9FUNG|nr:hypothetical protein DSO57_1030572 [Entomophthora muscae]
MSDCRGKSRIFGVDYYMQSIGESRGKKVLIEEVNQIECRVEIFNYYKKMVSLQI